MELYPAHHLSVHAGLIIFDGRRRANATYFESHAVDATTGLSYAMDMTPLMNDTPIDIVVFANEFIQRFEQDVNDRIRRLS